jgi:CRISPR-associated protein Csd2
LSPKTAQKLLNLPNLKSIWINDEGDPTMTTPLKNRYEFILLYDVENGNPNGDPDAGNMPRIDPETGYGIVTDVCLKRKIRNYVELVKGDATGYRIYIKEGIPLNANHKEAYIAVGLEPGKKAAVDGVNKARTWMCKNFYDIRTFGAVLAVGDNCGQVRGPVQLNFSRSLDPIVQQEVTITRLTVTREEDAEKERTMGRKHIVPYGLYRVEGYISAKLANDETKGTGFSEEDLGLFWEALANMFEHDRSAARGKMAVRKLVIFKHESELGNAPAHRLFELVKVSKNPDANPPRSFEDYSVRVDKASAPAGVMVIEK